MLVIQRWESTAVDWESGIHIPGREYYQHMTRVPLTLGHSARRLPLQPLAHTDNAGVCVRDHMCVFVCHGRQPLTHHPRPHTMGKHRERRRSEEEKEEKEKKSDVWGERQNTLVPHMRPSDLWEGSFVRKGTTPSLPSHLCQTSPSPCHSRPGFALRI